MWVLALDTTTVRGSLALFEDEELRAEVRVTAPDGHSVWIFPAMDAVLTAFGLGPGDLDGLAVTLGPGSFTGVRVGVAAIQGLAAGTGTACLGFSALDVLAGLGPPGPKVALMDAWRNEVYAGVYDGGTPLGSPYAGPLEGLAGQTPARPVFVGDGAHRYGERIRELWPGASLPETDLFLAAPLGRVALRRFREGGSSGPESLSPLYIRGVDIRLPPQ